MSDYMLTTIDNPYDPFTQWDDWYKFDMVKGYDTCGYLARLAMTSPDYGDERNTEEIYNAQKLIVELEPKLYIRITAEDGKKIKNRK